MLFSGFVFSVFAVPRVASWIHQGDPGGEYGFHLEESAHSLGIDFIHETSSFDPKIKNITPWIQGMHGASVAVCDFNDDGLAEIAIWRIPARNAATVTQLLNKTMVFESNVATAFGRGAVFPSDLTTEYDFEALNLRVADQLPATMPKTHINRGIQDAHNVLMNALNAGPYIINYSGHGSTGAWQGNFITVSDAAGLTNAPNYSIYTLLTCFNGYFIQTQNDGLGEALLKAQNGGAAAVWACCPCACCLVSPSHPDTSYLVSANISPSKCRGCSK